MRRKKKRRSCEIKEEVAAWMRLGCGGISIAIDALCIKAENAPLSRQNPDTVREYRLWKREVLLRLATAQGPAGSAATRIIREQPSGSKVVVMTGAIVPMRSPFGWNKSTVVRECAAMKTSVLFVFAIVAVSSVRGQASFMRGNDFMSKCGDITVQTSDSVTFGFCMGYVEGVSDSIQLHQETVGSDGKKPRLFVCFPEEVTAGQLLRVVQKFIKEQPEHEHWLATPLINNALIKAFPCK